jgi:transcriptional regulator with XRE-family HTH domain
MSKSKQRYSNHLTRYRERLGFTQDQLAHIVNCKNSRTIRRFESGEAMPGSLMLLRLAAALRVPVDYLYQETFTVVQKEVRTTEERMPKGQQGVLPLPA